MNLERRRPNPIDIHVGGRARLRRSTLGMSQEKIAEHLGVSFQQIQKYEKGTNRVSASLLQEAARALGVPLRTSSRVRPATRRRSSATQSEAPRPSSPSC
jgi:transcriptional regulator with XRE-family HTH domain